VTTLLVAVLIVVVGVVAYVALRNAQDFSDANEVIPGVPTRAPKEWAGAHSPEARLHRRLRDSMEALRSNAALDDPSLGSIRADIERQALVTDDRLVAAAALPRGGREEPVRQLGKDVEAIEALVADLVELRGPTEGDVGRRLEEVRIRLALLAEARSELAALDPTTDLGGLPDLSGLPEPSGQLPGTGTGPEDVVGRTGEPGEEHGGGPGEEHGGDPGEPRPSA
jgi:hypothetical protein